jgi:hypothetical protein
MPDKGDYILNSNIKHVFNTNSSSGGCAALTSPSVMLIYKGAATTATIGGATLIPNYALSTGLNCIQINTANYPYYEAGYDYHAVLTAGTIDSIYVTDKNIFDFSIQNRGISASTMHSIAQTLLQVDWTSIPTTGISTYSVLNSLRALRNQVSLTASTMHIYDEYGNIAWTSNLTTVATYDGITGVTPA